MQAGDVKDMEEPSKTARTYGLSRLKGAVAAFGTIILLVSARAGCEGAAMWEYGSDPQMPIWYMFSAIVLAFWFLTGIVLAGLLAALWKRRWGVRIGLLLIVVWAVGISWESWGWLRYRQALADASNPSTSAERLSELVHFSGIEGGGEDGELDNRIASNPNTPPETLRELSKRGELGVRMCLARNPNTPEDVLQELTKNKDILKIRKHIRKPQPAKSGHQRN